MRALCLDTRKHSRRQRTAPKDRSAAVVEAIKETGGVYFAAVGGAAAALAKCIVSEEVISYADLGTEALRKIQVKDFPVFVALDATGACLYV